MSEPSPPLPPLSRKGVTPLYLLTAAILVYFVDGSLQGKLEVPAKTGSLVLHGMNAWLACLFPLGMASPVYWRFDPSVKLAVSLRQKLMYASFGLGLLALLAAVVLENRP